MEKQEAYQITREQVVKAVAKHQDCKENEVDLKDFSLAEGCGFGENFTTSIKAIEINAVVKCQHKLLNYIAKCVPVNAYRAHFLESFNGFKKECVSFQSLLEKCSALRKNAGLCELAVPKCYLADLSSGLIIMENLKPKGYRMLNNVNGEVVTVDIAKLVLKEMTGLHATGYHFLETCKGGFESFEKDYPDFCSSGWLNDDNPRFKVLIENVLAETYKGILGVVKMYADENDKHLAKRMEEFEKHHAQVMEEKLKPAKGFNAIIHNDLHMKNVMIKKKTDGSLDQLCLLDFQMMRRSKPALDLVYFFGSSTPASFRAKHLTELLKYYHECLVTELASFGYPVTTYTMEQLQNDYDDCWLFGFIMACIHIQYFMPEGVDFDVLMTDEQSHVELTRQLAVAQIDRAKEDKQFKQDVFDLVREAVERKLF